LKLFNDAPRPEGRTDALFQTRYEEDRKFRAAFREFVSAYKEAYQRILKHNLRLEFPDGALPPTAWCVSLTPG